MSDGTFYRYSTSRNPRGGFSARVVRFTPGQAPATASYQSGFANRTAAYRYARQMARALNRNHAWLN